MRTALSRFWRSAKSNPIRMLLRWALVYLMVMGVLRPLVLSLFRLEGRWGPPLVALVERPNKGQIELRLWHRSNGGETDEILEWIEGKKDPETYIINNTHALSLLYARIVQSEDREWIWIEGKGKVIATLNIVTRQFWKEGQQQPEIARYGTGTTLSEGRLTRWSDAIFPF